MAVRISYGLFWYYLEEVTKAPEIEEEKSFPVAHMHFKDIRKCAFRVIVYKNRIALEIYHALTDGNGAMVFLKTLVAEYLRERYGAQIPFTHGVLDCDEAPKDEELEDSFLKHVGDYSASRKDKDAYKITGTQEAGIYNNVIIGQMNVEDVVRLSKGYGVSVTAFLSSVLIAALIDDQNKYVPNKKRQKPVKLMMPVNLRKMFGSVTLRNFVSFVNPGVDPRMGEYTFEEIVKSVHHQMGMEITDKNMMSKITPNVKSETNIILRFAPLFIKNFAIKTVFTITGEKKSCMTFSNLGNIELPEEMKKYVQRFDFIVGPPSSGTYNCGVISYGGKLYVSFLSKIKEKEIEENFFCRLRKMGLHVKIESNRR